MCGLAGFWRRGISLLEGDERMAGEMARRIAHRGPDDSGVWCDDAAGIAMAHVRLSILDVSPAGHQPMVSHSGRFVVAFNGEIYNFRDLLHEVTARSWRGHSDTEILLASFEDLGVERTLQKAVGMFAFALWDRSERTLWLGRDRMGEKPLYYGQQGGVVFFASELKALAAHPGFVPEVDRGSLASYLRYCYVPAPYSIYRGLKKVEPGTVVRLREAGPEQITTYWSMAACIESGRRDPFTGSDQEAVSLLDQTINQAVALQRVADVPLGAFLSGGIDSSTVVAVMQSQSQRPVKTFTIGWHERDYNEAGHAKAVARHLGTDHTELYVTPDDARSVIPALPSLYDEPFADPSQIPTHLVAKLARKHVTVSLSGDGGDELFGGYNRYFWGDRIWKKVSWMPRPMRRVAALAMTAVPVSGWDATYATLSGVVPARMRVSQLGDKVHKLASRMSGVSDLDDLYHSLVSEWSDPAELVIGEAEHQTLLANRVAWPHQLASEHRMMFLDSMTYLPDDILVKLDRATMGVSLEGRVPLLDHRVVELAWRLPLSMKIRGRQGKWLLRQVLYKYVPRELIERPKMGFGIPLGAWLRGPLRAWAEDLLDESRLAGEGFLKPAPIRQKWKEHLSGARDWQQCLWNVLMFQAWVAHQE